MSNQTDLQTLKQGGAANMPAVAAGFFDLQGFELLQRISKAFTSSELVPKQYQNNLPNCMIAMDMAQRIGANPLMVMQNLYVVHGTPGWSSKFLIATINVCGRYSSLRYEWKGEPNSPDYGCRAWAVERATNERLDGIWVTWAMVRAEGWSSKNGSKWNTMPDQMFVYRAAAFWQRAYAPELGMGLQTAEELGDVFDAAPDGQGGYSVTADSLRDVSGAVEREANRPARPTAKPEPKPEPEINPLTGELEGGEPTGTQNPTVDEALGFVQSGEFDMARDIARSLGEEERQGVEAAIAAKQAQARPRRTASTGSLE
ncbi:recombinase family protein [Chitinimonas naiadis]